MKRLSSLLLVLPLAWAQPAVPGGHAAAIGAQLRQEGFDPDECYRVRDLAIFRDEVRIYLTDGFLIFAKPVEGRRLAAVFITGDEGDGEILMMPPLRSERLSLAAFTGVPNLTEHFWNTLMVFTDNTGDEFLAHVRKTESRKSPDMGVLLASRWNETLLNIYSSFSVRIAQDLLDPGNKLGFFFSAFNTHHFGALDLIYDPRAVAQVTLGRLAQRDDVMYYDVWCHFEGRSWRMGRRPRLETEFKLSNYRIDAGLDQQLRMKAVTRVEVTPAAGLISLAFEISPRMHITEAMIDGQPAEVFQRESLRANLLRGSGNELFLIVPPEGLVKDRKYEVELRHEGDVVTPAGNGVYFVGSRGTWYPNRDLQFADYTLTFRYPHGLTMVGTGELIAERTEGDQQVVVRKTSTPVRLAGFNLGDYQAFTASEGGLTVDVYANRRLETALAQRPNSMVVLPQSAQWRRRSNSPVIALPPPPPPDPTERTQALANEIASAFSFFASRFGPPPANRITVSPIPGRFGQGFPGLIYLSTLSYLKPEDRLGIGSYLQIFFSDLLHAHEVAHQWWGNIVTTKGYQDTWIMEGLANYSALLHLEKKRGPRVLDQVLDEYRQRLLEKKADGKTIESVGPITWGIRLESSQAPTAWRTITYEKGSWIFHMLRRRMGDAPFGEMLATLCRRYRYKAISAKDLQSLAAEFLPPGSPDPELETFFDNWVNDVGIPTLKLSYSVKGKAPHITVTGTVRQSEVGEQFMAYVPLEVTTSRGKLTQWVATGEDTFSIRLKQAPVKVTLGPGNSVLAVLK